MGREISEKFNFRASQESFHTDFFGVSLKHLCCVLGPRDVRAHWEGDLSTIVVGFLLEVIMQQYI